MFENFRFESNKVKICILVYDPESPEEMCYKIQYGRSVAQKDSDPIYLVNSGKECSIKLTLLVYLFKSRF